MKPRKKKPIALKMTGVLYVLKDEQETITRFVQHTCEDCDPDEVRAQIEPVKKTTERS